MRIHFPEETPLTYALGWRAFTCLEMIQRFSPPPSNPSVCFGEVPSCPSCPRTRPISLLLRNMQLSVPPPKTLPFRICYRQCTSSLGIAPLLPLLPVALDSTCKPRYAYPRYSTLPVVPHFRVLTPPSRTSFLFSLIYNGLRNLAYGFSLA